MPDSDVHVHKPTALFLATLGGLTLYLIWLGVTGTPAPDWVYWISTVL